MVGGNVSNDTLEGVIAFVGAELETAEKAQA
jgi:hypothetical protein